MLSSNLVLRYLLRYGYRKSRLRKKSPSVVYRVFFKYPLFVCDMGIGTGARHLKIVCQAAGLLAVAVFVGYILSTVL